MTNDIGLETKFVGDIEGVFYVPDYQRGYRWGTEEVLRLLEDIYNNGKKTYCLQPIVVKNRIDSFELIDGQQRLTTLYLIYQYLYRTTPAFFRKPSFSLSYQTRKHSEEFLNNIDMSLEEENIDYWFICNAYKVIQEWFEEDPQSRMLHMFEYLKEDVKIIWYEVGESEDSIGLFTRLNIGKIPLTSAELIKAMFLSSGSGFTDRHKQEEVSLQWDNIERELRNDRLWSFLSNHSPFEYQTRIDLILDLIAKKKDGERDKYYSYFRFEGMLDSTTLDELWDRVVHSFYLLKDWYENHTLYHKIGYLIASESKSLDELFDESKRNKKSEFIKVLDGYISKSIYQEKDYSECSYENEQDKKSIYRLLLLFNVESVRQNGEETEWFPFDKFKLSDIGKVKWSLEHIHAQQSEGMKKEEQWREWLSLHRPFINDLDQELEERVDELLGLPRIERSEFEKVQLRILKLLSPSGNDDYIHLIGNLALLNCSDNAALSNSVFAVKRNLIIKMDRQGKFIPFCTRMVFLKYYTPSENAQMLMWAPSDREAYVSAINSVLEDYLKIKISL